MLEPLSNLNSSRGLIKYWILCNYEPEKKFNTILDIMASSRRAHKPWCLDKMKFIDAFGNSCKIQFISPVRNKPVCSRMKFEKGLFPLNWFHWCSEKRSNLYWHWKFIWIHFARIVNIEAIQFFPSRKSTELQNKVQLNEQFVQCFSHGILLSTISQQPSDFLIYILIRERKTAPALSAHSINRFILFANIANLLSHSRVRYSKKERHMKQYPQY